LHHFSDEIALTPNVSLIAGMHTWFAAAADPRIAVAVPLIGVQVVLLICDIVNLGAKSSLP
jgi:hypothetical protein